MPIAAKRFSFLDNETNVPVSDFVTAKTADILNTQTDLLAVTDQLQTLANAGNLKDVNGILNSVFNANTIGLSRITKDFFSSYKSLNNVGNADINSLSEQMFPDPTLRNAFSQIGVVCKSNVLAGLGNCRNKHPLAKLNGLIFKTNNRTCNLYGFVNLINRLTNGRYLPTLVDQCALARMISGIASRGFQLGLPAVFSSISGLITDQHLLAQSGAIVLGSVANEGNMNAVIDVAGSSVGPMIKAINPNITSTIMSNFQIPSELKDFEIGSFNNKFGAAMKNMDPYWDSSFYSFDGSNNFQIPSVENMNPLNSDLCKNYRTSMFSNEISLPSIDDFVSEPSNSSLLYGALNLNEPDTRSSIFRDFGDNNSNFDVSQSSNFSFDDW